MALNPIAPNAGEVLKERARILMQNHRAFYLAYRGDYDIVKYNFRAPVSNSSFETDKLKWHFIEFAKYFEPPLVPKLNPFHMVDVPVFLNMMYGEGFREPDLMKIDWIADIRSEGALFELFQAYKEEHNHRYDLLTSSLQKMRSEHNIQTIDDFRTFIRPIASAKTFQTCEPPMWNAIGYSPEHRANRTYSLSIDSFFLLDSALHLLDRWDERLAGEPQWDATVKRLKTYRRIHSYIYPTNTMAVRQIINSTMKFS